MILTGKAIHDCVTSGLIVIKPYRVEQLNPNSYNLKLGEKLLVYKNYPLDMRKENAVEEIKIPPEGLYLNPGVLYLGETEEYTETPYHVPCIEGRSSVGRLGMQVHLTAGFGDTGFKGKWTLEITVVHPLRVYAGAEVCQISYQNVFGTVTPYKGKYLGQQGVVPSHMFRDFVDNV
jgi:dCTP deaminase